MIRTNEVTAEVHGVVYQRERRVQVDLTLTRGLRNTTKADAGEWSASQFEGRDLRSSPTRTVFTPEGVDIVRGGPEHRRNFLTTLLTDVDPLTGDVIERFARVLSQRNALLRSLEGSRPSSTQQRELDQWTSDLCAASEQLLDQRQGLIDQRSSPLVATSYHELAQNDVSVGVRYERSWRGELLTTALERAGDDDRYRGYTTVGPHRDDIELSLEGRDARRQASQGEQRSLALALRLAGHELVRQCRGVDPLLLLDDVFSELDPVRSDRLLGLLPAGQTLVTTASPLPSSLTPAAVIDLAGVLS